METYYMANGNSEGTVKTLSDIWTIRIQASKYINYVYEEGSTTIPEGSTLIKTLGEMVGYYFCILPKVFVYCTVKYKIYTLNDPDTNEIKYVGKTTQSLKKRLAQHIRETYRFSTYKGNWVKSLLFKGKLPIIEVLDESNNNWQELESYWITQLKAWGFKLTNMTDGGDGNNNQVFSKETLQRKSLALKGIKRPKEVREKISKSHKGKKLSQITKEKLRNINLGKTYSEETKRKRYKSVLLIDEKGLIIEEFQSLKEAAEKHNCRKGSISNVCTGRCKTACGKFWKFK